MCVCVCVSMESEREGGRLKDRRRLSDRHNIESVVQRKGGQADEKGRIWWTVRARIKERRSVKSRERVADVRLKQVVWCSVPWEGSFARGLQISLAPAGTDPQNPAAERKCHVRTQG